MISDIICIYLFRKGGDSAHSDYVYEHGSTPDQSTLYLSDDFWKTPENRLQGSECKKR